MYQLFRYIVEMSEVFQMGSMIKCFIQVMELVDLYCDVQYFYVDKLVGLGSCRRLQSFFISSLVVIGDMIDYDSQIL